MKKMNKFHLCPENSMPIAASTLSLGNMMMIPKLVKNMKMKNSMTMMLLNMSFIFMWSMKTKEENMKEGAHSTNNIKILKYSFMLFIASEIMMFISLFWMYLNNSLSPNNEIGNQWPPQENKMPLPTMTPLYGSCLLIYSGMLLTMAHHQLNKNMKNKSNKNMMLTILMGTLFMDMQMSEYTFCNMMSFMINDSNYPNSFFSITAVHGSHVMAGLVMIIMSTKFMMEKSINMKNHSSFEISAWYWHFVDIVWLFVFSLIYWMNFFF